MAPPPPTNWSREVPGSDICLIVEGEQFFVGKYILARHSKYFDAMFGNNFAESGERQLPIPNKSKEDFRMFLDFVHNLGVEFEMDTTWPLLEMGEYFDAPVVMAAAEEFLTSSENGFSLIESFVLADRFRLPILMQWCKQQLKTTAECKQLQDSDRWDHFSEETQRLISTEYDRLTRVEQSTHQNPPAMATQQQPQNLNQYVAPNYYHAGYANVGQANAVMWGMNGPYLAHHPAAQAVPLGPQFAYAPHQRLQLAQYAPVAQVAPIGHPAALGPQYVAAPVPAPVPNAQPAPAIPHAPALVAGASQAQAGSAHALPLNGMPNARAAPTANHQP